MRDCIPSCRDVVQTHAPVTHSLTHSGTTVNSTRDRVASSTSPRTASHATTAHTMRHACDHRALTSVSRGAAVLQTNTAADAPHSHVHKTKSDNTDAST
jgi:hypothetical protein